MKTKFFIYQWMYNPKLTKSRAATLCRLSAFIINGHTVHHYLFLQNLHLAFRSCAFKWVQDYQSDIIFC